MKRYAVKTELAKFLAGFIFGATTITILKLIYGPTGWNVLITVTIFTAYFIGQIRKVGEPHEFSSGGRKQQGTKILG